MKKINLKKEILFFLAFFLCVHQFLYADYIENQFVIIIPSYNNETVCERNITSVFTQDYTNYRIIYIDDCSDDSTYNQVCSCIDRYQASDRCTVIKNEERQLALANLYYAIWSCEDHEIVVNLDGDDWFAHDAVLSRLNEEYQDQDVWITSSQFQYFPWEGIGYGEDLPADVRADVRRIRKHCWKATALRTFRAWLFKKIKKEDLMYEGKFFPIAWDHAIIGPMLEMASPHHFRFIPDVLYIYNCANPINDYRVHGNAQYEMGKKILAMEPYQPLDKEN